MPQPNTHYLIIEEALKNHPSGQWQNHSNFAGLGSFGPDLFYLLGIPHVIHSRKYPSDYTKVSDVMHHEASLDFFCCMLDYIKNTGKGAGKETADKLKAFAYGYYSHAATDSVFHPLVYRHTGDNWQEHFTREYNQHKKLEALIDTYLLERIKGENPFSFGYQHKVECHKQDSKRTLDADVFQLLKHCIAEIYGRSSVFEKNGVNYEEHFGHGIDEAAREGRHPILEAYRDYITAFRELYFIGRFVPRRLNPFIPIASINLEQRRQLGSRKKWQPSENPWMPDYSIPELFEFAVKDVKKAIDAAERFFAGDAASSREFFSREAGNVVFMDENYNLDTGLPSTNNAALIGLPTQKEIFEFGLAKLDSNYRTIDSYVV